MYGENHWANAQATTAPAFGIGNQAAANYLDTQPASVLDSIGKSVSQATMQVNEMAQRARSIADSVFGAMPTGNGQGENPPTAGKASAVERETRVLFDALAELRTQIDRLTCI